MKKKFTLVILFVLIFNFSCTPTKKAIIDRKAHLNVEFTKYLKLYESKQFEACTDLILEAYFDHVPKETLISTWKHVYLSNEKSEKNFRNFKITHINNPILIDDTYYSEIMYTGTVEIIYKGMKKESETDEEYLESQRKAKTAMQIIFGEDNVTYNPAKDSFEISLSQRAFGILKDSDSTWKFLNYDEGEIKILKQLIPNELLDSK